MNEEWHIIDFNDNYAISNLGNVKNIKTNYILKLRLNKGYYYVSLRDKTNTIQKIMLVHRLVAQYFITNPENKSTVNHIDRNTNNNCYTNLEWSSLSEQQYHRYSTDKPIDFGFGPAKKTIYRINKDTNEILEAYPSITLAIKWLFDNAYTKFKVFNNNTLASLRSKILEQIKGQRHSVYGFKWKYEETKIDNEIWKTIDPLIVNNSQGYLASSIGRIKSPKGKLCCFTTNAYNTVTIGNKTYYVHRIIAQVFIPNPENKLLINHIDGNKINNNINNLEWVTHSENTQHWLKNLK